MGGDRLMGSRAICKALGKDCAKGLVIRWLAEGVRFVSLVVLHQTPQEDVAKQLDGDWVIVKLRDT